MPINSFCSLLAQDIIDLSHHEHEHMIAWSRGHLFIFLFFYVFIFKEDHQLMMGSRLPNDFSPINYFYYNNIIFLNILFRFESSNFIKPIKL